METDSSEKGSKSAPFNMVLASLERLDFHRRAAGQARYNQPVSLNVWLRALENQFTEILCMQELDESEEKGFEKIQKQYYDMLGEHLINPVCKKKPAGTCEHFAALQWKLDELDKYTSKLIMKYNLAMPEKGNVFKHMGEGF